jgi:hypothetical protein
MKDKSLNIEISAKKHNRKNSSQKTDKDLLILDFRDIPIFKEVGA